MQEAFAVKEGLVVIAGVDEAGAVDLEPVARLPGQMHFDPAIRAGIAQRRNNGAARGCTEICAPGVSISDVNICIARRGRSRLSRRRQDQE